MNAATRQAVIFHETKKIMHGSLKLAVVTTRAIYLSDRGVLLLEHIAVPTQCHGVKVTEQHAGVSLCASDSHASRRAIDAADVWLRRVDAEARATMKARTPNGRRKATT